MRQWLKVILTGLLSLGAYVLVFAHDEEVTDYFTRGSWYAALPVVTALVVALVHGAFAGALLEALGLRPAPPRPDNGRDS